ncbi:protein Hikeshi-like [Asterias rubens]|uniref:protein Hikeshi-like n=1 Tax=Asterias rubens TaxID=7604 RepID=UPI0014557A3E|nr:protein Hikeshi-like [Asterias rubens]
MSKFCTGDVDHRIPLDSVSSSAHGFRVQHVVLPLFAVNWVKTDIQRFTTRTSSSNNDSKASINHIVVFLQRPRRPGPERFQREWAGPSTSVGRHRRAKWSGCFSVSSPTKSQVPFLVGLKKGSSTNNSFMQSMPVQQPMKTMSQIGISVEPLHVIQHQIPAETTQTLTLTSFSEFSMKMLENFYNFASSFGINQSQMTPQPNISWIPMTVLDKWFQNFKKKMAQDQNFWRK